MSTPDYTPNWSKLLVETTPVWNNYLDLQLDVKPYMQIPAQDTTRDLVLQDLVDTACWWVQEYLARPIAPTEFARRFDGYSGYSGAYIELPYYPILSIIEVVEWWGSNGPQVLTQMIPENQIGGGQNYTLDALRGRLTRSFSALVARPWFPSLAGVEICWVAGYNPIPPTIRFATRELIKYWWTNTQQASRTGPRGSSEYGGSITPNEGLWPNVPNRVSELLQPWVQVGIA
jgi:hypothetical protein